MGWGSSTPRGGGRKVYALPRKFVSLGFRREESGMSREFCWDVQDSWGVFKDRSPRFGVGRRGSHRFVPISPFSSDLFRFAVLV